MKNISTIIEELNQLASDSNILNYDDCIAAANEVLAQIETLDLPKEDYETILDIAAQQSLSVYSSSNPRTIVPYLEQAETKISFFDKKLKAIVDILQKFAN